MSQFLKFILVGLINTAVGYIVFLVGLHFFSLVPSIANTFSYAIALIFSFFLSKNFVFDYGVTDFRAIIKFICAFIIAFTCNQMILYVGYNIFALPAEVAQIFAMCTYTTIFFIINKLFVFKR